MPCCKLLQRITCVSRACNWFWTWANIPVNVSASGTPTTCVGCFQTLEKVSRCQGCFTHSPFEKHALCQTSRAFAKLLLPSGDCVSPSLRLTARKTGGPPTNTGDQRAAGGDPWSRSEQPQAVQSTFGRVTYSKGLAARRRHRSPKRTLATIRTALKESKETWNWVAQDLLLALITPSWNKSWNTARFTIKHSQCWDCTASVRGQTVTYSKGWTSTVGSRGRDTGHVGTHAWCSTGE